MLIVLVCISFAISAKPVFENIIHSEDPDEITFVKAKESLPYYYKFLVYFKEKGYTFWDFHKFWIADKKNLPDRLIVLRHDVHFRDITFAYYTYKIEEEVLGANVATYYVMLDDIPEESAYDYNYRKTNYLNLIKFLRTNKVDVQPHVSPCDMYIKKKNPWWKDLDKQKLIEIFQKNYTLNTKNELMDISINKKDCLDILDLNKIIIPQLANYNKEWEKETGLKVESICAHGSHTPMNYIINNAVILDQKLLHNYNLFKFTPLDKYIFDFLTCKSDNEAPLWIEKPQLIKDKHFELLAHPYVWNNPDSYRKCLPINL